MELEQTKADFAKRGLNVASLTYDSAEVLRSFAERKGLDYPMLSDPESEVIRAFDILNDNIPSDHAFHGVPFPGTYIVDANGIVKAKFFEDDHRERYTASNILVRHFSDGTGQANTSVETKHLELTYSASDSAVRSGNRLALVVDVELKPKMHVYAPGVEGGYIPIDWRMPESKGWLALDAKYPDSKMLHLEAINETVPVYEGRFRMVRDLLIGQTREMKPLVADGKLTVEGSFRYQACDDRMCYRPETIPLKWTFPVDQHDRQRAPEEIRR